MYPELVVALASSHANCRVSVSGPGAPPSLSSQLQDTTWISHDISNPLYSNDAMHLTVGLGTLAPGDAATIEWAYALSQDAVDTVSGRRDNATAIVLCGAVVDASTLVFAVTVPSQVVSEVTAVQLSVIAAGATLVSVTLIQPTFDDGDVATFQTLVSTDRLPPFDGYLFAAWTAYAEPGYNASDSVVHRVFRVAPPAPTVLTVTLSPQLPLPYLVSASESVVVTITAAANPAVFPDGTSAALVSSLQLYLTVGGAARVLLATTQGSTATVNVTVDPATAANTSVILTAVALSVTGAVAAQSTRAGAVLVESTVPPTPSPTPSTAPPPLPDAVTVLLAVFASTGGAHWVSSTGWNQTTGPLCSWQGITCDNGNVVYVYLQLLAARRTGLHGRCRQLRVLH